MTLLKRLSAFLLLATLAIAGCKKDKYDLSDLHPTVKSFFTIVDNEVDMDAEIKFTNASESATTYSWDFGDGTSSTESSPVKAYPDPGVYTVTLKAVGPGGTGRFSRDITVIDPNASTGDKELYFIETNTSLIKKMPLAPGTPAQTVVDMNGKSGHGMAYDAVNKKIYYCDFQTTNSGKVWRMDLDGTNQEQLVSGLTSPYGVALNLAAGKMYIIDGTNVLRANLDGTGLEKEFIKITGGLMRAIGYNTQTDIIYFYEVNNEDMYIAKGDGTGVTKLISKAYGYGLFIDEVNQKLYYDDRRQTGIMQANLDGSGIVKIASTSGNRGGSGMTIDYSENKFYWAETNNGFIKRANLDGTGAETLLSGVSNPRGMFIK